MDQHERHLLKTHMEGFHDELWSIPKRIFIHPSVQYAYDLGRDYAIIGDEVTSIDRKTDEEILNIINNYGNSTTKENEQVSKEEI